MLYPVMCARTFQSARCELLVPNQHSPGEKNSSISRSEGGSQCPRAFPLRTAVSYTQRAAREFKHRASPRACTMASSPIQFLSSRFASVCPSPELAP